MKELYVLNYAIDALSIVFELFASRLWMSFDETPIHSIVNSLVSIFVMVDYILSVGKVKIHS